MGIIGRHISSLNVAATLAFLSATGGGPYCALWSARVSVDSSGRLFL
jgi:hypothetical protein